MATIKADAEELSFTMHSEKEKWQAGAVVSYIDNQNYYFAKIIDGKRGELHHYKEKKWQPVRAFSISAPKDVKSATLRVTVKEGKTTLFVAGEQVAEWKLPKGKLGVMVAYSKIRFSDITWKSSEKKKKKK